MKKSTKRTIKIWTIGILFELAYAGALYGLNKAFGLTVNSMFYFISSSLILSVCLYFDKFVTPKKEGKTEEKCSTESDNCNTENGFCNTSESTSETPETPTT